MRFETIKKNKQDSSEKKQVKKEVGKIKKIRIQKMSNSQTQSQNKKQNYSEQSFYKQKSSAFKPFKQNSQQSTILNEQQETLRIFNKLKRRIGCQDFLVNQIAWAKCLDQPLWPCKIIQVNRFPGLLPEIVYHIKFINQNNFSYVNQCHLLKFTQSNVQDIKEVVKNKKLLKSIKIAQKHMENQALKQKNCSQAQTDMGIKSKDSQSQQQQEKISKNKQGFLCLNQLIKTSVQSCLSQSSQNKQAFQPIILFKKAHIQINLPQIQALKKKSQRKNNQSKVEQRRTRSSNIQNLQISNHTKIVQIPKQQRKPLNLVIQTPKIGNQFYINKIILRFSQLQDKEMCSSFQAIYNDQTRMEDYQRKKAQLQQQILSEKPNQLKQITTDKKNSKKQIKKSTSQTKKVKQLQFLIKDYLLALQNKQQIQKIIDIQLQIIQSITKLKLIDQQKYKPYKKILKTSLKIIKILQERQENPVFCVDLKKSVQKLKKFVEKIDKKKDKQSSRAAIQKQFDKLLRDAQKEQAINEICLSLEQSTIKSERN